MSIVSLLRQVFNCTNSVAAPAEPHRPIEGLESRSLLSVAADGACADTPAADAMVVSLKRTAVLNLIGTFKGNVTVTGFGKVPLTLVVTSQPKGKIVGTLSAAGADPVAFKAKVTYGSGNTFTADINNSSGVAHITGKLVGSKLTGSLTGSTASGTSGAATFSLKRQ